MKGRLLNTTVSCDRRPQIFHLLLKAAYFVDLVEFRIEQDKAAVTQNQYANHQEDVSTPSQDGMSSCRRRDPPFDYVLHGWLLRASFAGEGFKGAE